MANATLANHATASTEFPSQILPVSPERLTQLQHQLPTLLDGLNPDALWWLSGYIAGMASQRQHHSAESKLELVASEPQHLPVVTVLYGSQTGNAERTAQALFASLQQQNPSARLLRADQYSLKQLKSERQLFIVISTQGDGDPPEDARALYQQIFSARAPNLPELSFSVLGLGDASYPKFNHVAKSLAQRLQELGAKQVIASAYADVVVEPISKPWLEQVEQHAKSLANKQKSNIATLPVRKAESPVTEAKLAVHKTRARILANQRICSRHSSKDVRHIELALLDSNFKYEPGDAIKVHISNPEATVQEILRIQGWQGDAVSALEQSTVYKVLKHQVEITRTNKAALEFIAERSASSKLNAILQNPEHTQHYLAQTQLLDVLLEHPSELVPDQLFALLRPLKPRAYSIASAQSAVGAELHLTVAHVQYQVNQQARYGAASHDLATQEIDHLLTIELEPNARFRLPNDASRDIIMIGPGTGVAPFRAFVQERVERAASGPNGGRNWLFFGNPHLRHDFLYQLEWQQALKAKQLHRLDVAFSRDQPAKIYVQDRLRQAAAELYAWLENGAHIYVCGDAKHMAKDVELALIDVIASASGKDRDFAQDYIAELAQQKRYQRDIY